MPSAPKLVYRLPSTVYGFLFVALISIFILFSPQPAFADCSGDLFTWESGQCIHRTGGVSDPENPEADDQGCVYTFIPSKAAQNERECAILNTTDPGPSDPNPSTAPNPSTSPGTSPAPGSSLSPSPVTSPLIVGDREPVDKNNYKAPQNANYTVLNLEHTFLCELAGTSPIDKCLGSTKGSDGKPLTFLYERNPGGGAMGTLAGVVGTMYNPPTSSVQYIAGVIKNFGFAEPAYAQTTDVPGSGSSVIFPVLSLWQAVRNISYLAFILIFLGVGFMIMFRQKINPQTVVTAQAALPGLVIGLLLVTFSYFIAALIIDLAFVGIPLVTNIVTQATPDNAFGNPSTLEGMARDSNILQMFSTTAARIDIGKINAGVSDTIRSTPATQIAGGLIMAVIGGIIGSFLGPVGIAMGAVAGGATGPFFSLSGLISIVLPLILIIGLFVQMFKLLLALISTYLQLLVATLTGPFVILASSLPGKGGGIGGWLKTLLANALVFPAVFAAFLFAGVILGTNPSAWHSTPPLFGGLSFNIISILLGYGIIMAMPAIPDAVRGAFGIKPQQGGIVGAALGGFMAGTSVGKAGAGKLIEPYRERTKTYMSEQQKRIAGYPTPTGGGWMQWQPWMRVFGGRPNP